MPLYKILFISTFIFLSGSSICAQSPAKADLGNMLYSLSKSRPDTNRVKILWGIGDHYLYKPGEKKQDIDSAFLFLRKAVGLSEQLAESEWKNKVSVSLAAACFEARKAVAGRLIFKEIISFYKKTGKASLEGDAWLTLGDQLKNTDTTHQQKERLACYQRSYELQKKACQNKSAILALTRWTQTALSIRDYDEALKGLLKIKAESEKSKLYTNIYGWAIDNLTTIAASKGDFYKQLFYQIENLNALKKHPEYYTVNGEIMSYNRITDLYLQMDDYKKAEIYALKELDLTLKAGEDYVFPLDNLLISLLNQGKASTALAILQRTVRAMPPKKMQEIDVSHFYGRVYAAMHNFKKADLYFQRAARLYEAIDPQHKNIDYLTSTYETAAEYYISTKQFKMAAPFVSGLAGIREHFSNVQKSNLELMTSKVDSSSGRYLLALQHFQAHSFLKDTIFNMGKVSQMNQLEVAFETKEKQNKINVLNSQNKENLARAAKARLERNITIAGIIIMIIISGIAYNVIRNKIKSNRLLRAQKDEIDLKNGQLEILLNDKEKLLTEKEGLIADKDILLKEVHHRVKNNLQIVMSLLSTQSEYLENREALQAIEESQQRVQAIALIHQKIYHETGGVNVRMPSYISNMVEDFMVFSNAEKRGIRIMTMVEELDLDIDVAVPVGLILNEGITNAIKYAFGDKGGLVEINMHRCNDQYHLLISDNGKGLPPEFDLRTASSLGMVMMKGLSGQVQGSFNIINSEGLTLSLKFPMSKTK
ncbi:histidine kinase dimerization/phosphoacceptor domain -containing protein [Mucilaginibacter lutimaris]|uniref:histidine kinase n=1 Tax=Mucilaginibacter lutimaris TaxID=931629 RepID=A0ABW2ZEE7_9SPHI